MHWPSTLFSRLMTIWLAGLVLVLAASLTLFGDLREQYQRHAHFENIAGEIAGTLDFLESLPTAERHARLRAPGRQRLHFIPGPLPPGSVELGEEAQLVQAFRHTMPERTVTVWQIPPTLLPGPGRGGPGLTRLLLGLELADGETLYLRLPPRLQEHDLTPPSHVRLFAALATLFGGIGLIVWFAVRLATRPLSQLAEAARALGEDPDRAPLPVSGPAEVRQAATAFNQMQERIRAHVGERTRILAAITHDLQTPITRLRLRAELIDDETLQTRVQADLDAMQALVREGLDYARSLDPSHTHSLTDINQLIDALAADAQDMGWAVQVHGRAQTPLSCQPAALRRALWNLVENGIKFGERVDIGITDSADHITFTVRDHGPGLPADELEKVFEPFYRTEQSRNRETGGTGLGLAIARNLVARHGGSVNLANAPDGGLLATLDLPRQYRVS